MRVCGTLSLSDGTHLASAEMLVQVVAAVLVVIVLLRTTYKYRTQQNTETAKLSAFQLTCSPDVMLSRAGIMVGVTAHKISKHVTLLVNDIAATPASTIPPGQPKPLCLLLPWLGSRPQAIGKYCDIYIRTGFDILVVESEVSQFLWPRWGLENGARVLELLESDRFSQRPLLVHAFSIGGYTFSQVLVHVAEDNQRCQKLTNRIRGHIYDSLVMGSLDHMAVGRCCIFFSKRSCVHKMIKMLCNDLMSNFNFNSKCTHHNNLQTGY
ncbi:hypothetical protein IRJ41_024259 [Triplophysa rosa]|uniref:Transmembrane protein 53 n=1 Tax=Triplophysa rosa TaxID=992332 RepID=A0A9W7TUI4_TRIRA|nr:hypothetical protein IRJ41_024259 [Triplophysa rosa]